ncbi:MAG: hypothetical protein ACP5HC_06255 [Caldisericum sp.]
MFTLNEYLEKGWKIVNKEVLDNNITKVVLITPEQETKVALCGNIDGDEYVLYLENLEKYLKDKEKAEQKKKKQILKVQDLIDAGWKPIEEKKYADPDEFIMKQMFLTPEGEKKVVIYDGISEEIEEIKDPITVIKKKKKNYFVIKESFKYDVVPVCVKPGHHYGAWKSFPKYIVKVLFHIWEKEKKIKYEICEVLQFSNYESPELSITHDCWIGIGHGLDKDVSGGASYKDISWEILPQEAKDYFLKEIAKAKEDLCKKYFD